MQFRIHGFGVSLPHVKTLHESIIYELMRNCYTTAKK